MLVDLFVEKPFDLVVCGSCVVDVLVRPVALDEPIGGGQLVRTEPLVITTGGIVSNTGTTAARLGMRTAAFSYVGNDEWADVIRAHYTAAGIETSQLMTHPTAGTSTTAVLIDPSGERSFLHAVGAPKLLNKGSFLTQLDFFAQSRVMLLGYFSLLPNLQDDLPEVLAAIRAVGCQTALDAAGSGGTLDSLAPSLPHLDYYVPSYKEAAHQTGESDSKKIIAAYREAGATGLLGVKLGTAGVVLSPPNGEMIKISAVTPPGPVIDTTGAGDCFFGGLLAGLLRGLSIQEAGKLGVACGACCVTGLGATTAIRDYDATARLAGID